MRRRARNMALLLALVLTLVTPAVGQERPAAVAFKVGFAQRDVTPTRPTPMWGYGDRHADLSTGALDPLYAKAVVIEVGANKLALVGLDIGRSPIDRSMEAIRGAVLESAGVNFVMISGSHTHHGPVIELRDEPEMGRGKYDDAVAYAAELEKKIIDAIVEAATKVQPARIGWGSARVEMNRNRHTKLEPKPIDSELSVIRFDDLEGRPIALGVNFSAHPTMISSRTLKFSADYPGQMMNAVQDALGAPTFFMQGSAGDLSVRTTPETKDYKAFGAALATEVIRIAEGIETTTPETPSIQAIDDVFSFDSRVDPSDPLTKMRYSIAFFPELVASFTSDLPGGRLRPRLTTVLLNGELALVGASGEFFADHALRLKRRSRAKKTLFFGYCNGYHWYFPTIEAAAEGGYGADASVSWVELGAGETMMNKALINIYTLLGSFAAPEAD